MPDFTRGCGFREGLGLVADEARRSPAERPRNGSATGSDFAHKEGKPSRELGGCGRQFANFCGRQFALQRLRRRCCFLGTEPGQRPDRLSCWTVNEGQLRAGPAGARQSVCQGSSPAPPRRKIDGAAPALLSSAGAHSPQPPPFDAMISPRCAAMASTACSTDGGRAPNLPSIGRR